MHFFPARAGVILLEFTLPQGKTSFPRPRGGDPVWAGKSRLLHFQIVHDEDHPRMGGEKFVDESHFYKNLGSPPHGRGNADPKRHRTRQAGITPA